jgi:hypothetical protein
MCVARLSPKLNDGFFFARVYWVRVLEDGVGLGKVAALELN